MTEKRYYIGNGKNCTICDSKKGGSDFFNMLTQYQAVDLLNEQHEQIEDLKDTNVRCCNEYSYFHKRMMELEKENQHIKTTIREAYNNERTDLGKSVLKQLLEAIQ